MNKSTFRINKMDCAAEEQLVRMRLDENKAVKQLSFDIPNRRLTVYHYGEIAPITEAILTLNLDSKLLETGSGEAETITGNPGQEKRLLWYVLLLNLSFFVIEVTTGFISGSMGLVADSLDMLADALVYGLSLFAVGGTVVRKKAIAKTSGYFQLVLALLGLAEVLRRFLGFEQLPDFKMMLLISFLALLANSLSLYLLQRTRSREAHMQASMIFTSNDVIANIGVMAAGVLVYVTGSNKPDLIIGILVFMLVGRGAFRILSLSR